MPAAPPVSPARCSRARARLVARGRSRWPEPDVQTALGGRPRIDGDVDALADLVAHLDRVARLVAECRERLDRPGPDRAEDAGPPELVDPLTARELAVLRRLPSSLSTGEIARASFVSLNTVKTQVQSVYRKLGVNSRHAAVERARRLGLL